MSARLIGSLEAGWHRELPLVPAQVMSLCETPPARGFLFGISGARDFKNYEKIMEGYNPEDALGRDYYNEGFPIEKWATDTGLTREQIEAILPKLPKEQNDSVFESIAQQLGVESSEVTRIWTLQKAYAESLQE